MRPDSDYPRGLFDGLFWGWWLVAFLTVISFLLYRDGLPDFARELALVSLPDIEDSFELWSRLATATTLTDGAPAVLLSLPGPWLVDRLAPAEWRCAACP